MIKQFEGFKSEPVSAAFPMLPAGTYVGKIMNVKIVGKEPDQQLVLRLDITEGEYANYWTNRFNHERANTSAKYEAKYKGDYRIQIPNHQNTNRAHPEWDVRAFNHMVFCVEHSNDGYRWNWDETSLKGKTVGINVREAVYQGNTFTQIGKLEVADDVRKGLVKPMKPRDDKTQPAYCEEPAPDAQSGFVKVETDELPF